MKILLSVDHLVIFIARLQSVLHATTRLIHFVQRSMIFSGCKCQSVKLKLVLLICQCLQRIEPPYLTSKIWLVVELKVIYWSFLNKIKYSAELHSRLKQHSSITSHNTLLKINSYKNMVNL